MTLKLSDIKMATQSWDISKSSVTQMLEGEIPGASVYACCLSKGGEMSFNKQNEFIRIFFLCNGSASFETEGKSFSYAEKAVFSALPQSDVKITTKTGCGFLEIRWDMNSSDIEDLAKIRDDFPITQAYKDALQYRDFFKSETTISRAIIKQSIIPRFAMGSVEAKGDDLVGQHSHPLLDQFFFSFPENDMDLLIDCRICPMKGNTLLHIPLGSNHGVIAKGQQRMHYLWIDFTPQEQKDEAVAYLNDVHKPTGEKQTIL